MGFSRATSIGIVQQTPEMLSGLPTGHKPQRQLNECSGELAGRFQQFRKDRRDDLGSLGRRAAHAPRTSRPTWCALAMLRQFALCAASLARREADFPVRFGRLPGIWRGCSDDQARMGFSSKTPASSRKKGTCGEKTPRSW